MENSTIEPAMERETASTSVDKIKEDDVKVDDKLPRACYAMLRGLGVWQPRDCKSFIFLNYTRFVAPSLSIGCAIAFLLQFWIHSTLTKRSPTSIVGEVLNSLCTTVDLICPYWFCKYYCYRKSYQDIMIDAIKLRPCRQRQIVWWRRFYTRTMAVFWISCIVFFYFHWASFFSHPWHYAVYILALIYATGWWASWLSVYGFVCAVHRVQLNEFVEDLETKLSNSDRSDENESKIVAELLDRYNCLEHMLDSTQNDLGFIISLAVVYHVIDIAIFSYAYWSQDFGADYLIWQYFGGVFYDLISIFAKLYPAAIVSRATRKITKTAASQCKTFTNNSGNDPVRMPEQRMELYHHLIAREEHMGLHVLGVKISIGFTIGLLVTIVSTATSLLRFAVPHLKLWG